MEGKGGNDTYYVDNAGDKVVEAAGEGTDIVFVTIGTYVLPANVEHLSLDAPWLAFHATGNALDNNIQGGFANDVLDGGAGADTLTGGAGNDTYLLDNAGDRVIEHEGGGTDEIRTSLGARNDFANMFVLPEHIENLTGTSATGQGVYGNAHHNVIKMGAGHDLIVMQDGGNDTVNGGGGDDFVFYGGALNTLDVNDGGAGYDGLGLLGNYDYVFNGSNLINFEKLAVYSSGGGVLMPYSYKLTMSDQNVAAGKNLMVVGQSLMSNETLTFDGSGETNGSYNVRGGKGSDTIVTGAGADQLYGNLGADSLSGGAGNDIFEYYSAAESTRTQWDTILDFNRGDKINLINIDADGNSANGNGKFSYIGSESFSGKAGELRVAQSWDGWLVEADVNGDGAADLMISVQTTYGQMLSASDFWL
jgi:Ca2+-binding RTX toxin-like protein